MPLGIMHNQNKQYSTQPNLNNWSELVNELRN